MQVVMVLCYFMKQEQEEDITQQCGIIRGTSNFSGRSRKVLTKPLRPKSYRSETISSPGGVKVDDDQLGPGGLELRLEVRLVFDLVHHLVVLPVVCTFRPLRRLPCNQKTSFKHDYFSLLPVFLTS